MRFQALAAVAVLAAAGCAAPAARDLEAPLAAIRAVGPEGQGNPEAAAAWRRLVDHGPDALLPTLRAFAGASPRAANWLRSAADAIADRGPLDPAALEDFIRDPSQAGSARRLAFERLARIDPAAPDRLLPGMLDDPGQELRRDAVARATASAQKLPADDDRRKALHDLLPHARDRDQVDALAKSLKALGVDVDLQAHYGVVPRWTLLSTFDNSEMKGFDAAYPPEQRIDLTEPLPGKGGKPVRSVDCATADPHGKVDLNTTLGKEMGAVAYAWAAVESDADRPVEVRVATNNAVKIFLNGRLAFFRNEYHHGMKMDQYVARGSLRKGRNEILLKICQNEQKEDWAQSWGFQGRICDALGGAVPVRHLTGGSK